MPSRMPLGLKLPIGTCSVAVFKIKMQKDYGSYTPERETKQTRSSATFSRDEENAENEIDSRIVDLENDQESPFLRGPKRIPARRGTLPRSTANRIKHAAIAALALGIIGGTLAAFYSYAATSWRFRINSSDNISVSGAENVVHAQVMDVVGGDIGRNIFFVPLAERKKQLEEIPWIESAAVMRLLPNHLSINVRERTPVSFVRMGTKVYLMDVKGVLLELPPHSSKKYSFPVITGMDADEPLSSRAASMKIFTRLMHDLDSEGSHYSTAISEVDLADPEDVKVMIADADGAVLVHLGDDHFLQRYKIYLAHLQEWRQQFSKVESVDLRYDRQVIVNPDAAKNAEVNASAPASKRMAMHSRVTKRGARH